MSEISPYTPRCMLQHEPVQAEFYTSYKKTTLETADDVKNYVKDLREKLLDEVNNKRKIYL